MPAFSTYPNKDMEIWLWVTYWSGAFWIFGWVVMLPVGTALYTWYFIESIINMFELFGGVGTFEDWMNPVRRAWLGSFIYMCAVVNSIIPGWGILTSWLFGWWAVADYYDYNYGYFEGTGPLPPPVAA